MSVKRLVPLNTVSLETNPSNARIGDIYYNTQAQELRVYDGTAWHPVSASLDTESVQDIVSGVLSAGTHSGITVTYDDDNNKINLSAAGAVTEANEYTDEAVASLGNSLPDIYVPISAVGNADGVASLGPDGFVPDSELNIDERIQDTAALMLTSATHTNITVDYDDQNGRLSLSSTGGTSANISASAPSNPNTGDLWLDSDTAVLYIYDGSFWVEISGAGGGGGGTGGSGNFTLSTTPPTSPTEGDTWFNTAEAKLYVYYDSFWIEAIATGATGPQGPSFLEYQGAWSSGVSYLENDGVTYQGSLWRLNEVSSPAGTVPSTPNWQLVIQKGDKGDTGEMTVGTVTTVAHGNPATVTNVGTTTDAILNFQIPGGPRSTIDIGDVTTVSYGANAATVTNVGTETDAIFDFEIPAGPRSTIEVGTVTTGSYSSSATVTNVGTTSDAVFNFSIPQGIPGDFQPGVNPPANPLAGQVWYNTTVGRAYVYYDGFWIEFSPGFTGQQGAVGAAGPAGADGDTPFTLVGAYDNGADYTYGDAVYYNGGTYVRTGNPNNPGYPPTPGSINASWTPIADKGDQGTAGEDGAAGAGFGIYYLGNYVSTNGYLPDVAVVRGSDGQLYLAKASGQLADPVDYQNNGQWEVWIPKGADGADGADGQDGSSLVPLEVSSNITMQASYRYFVDTSVARTLTLPASPALNDEIQILDASGTASTYNITVARNGNKINGGTGNLIIDMDGAWATLLYTGSTYGWKVG